MWFHSIIQLMQIVEIKANLLTLQTNSKVYLWYYTLIVSIEDGLVLFFNEGLWVKREREKVRKRESVWASNNKKRAIQYYYS